ncbi:cyclase [Caulobacter sp. CCUG 60055]|uniref:SRPBCC family protein n=1 Tax=Caulobacter sp. CCUG 60055 TaxID=2100090 RepID=UPI001FA7761A|nr:SRPBCC family protein [Caulobacter sp. CCUG 60055]MCI3179979.1 cyclase [Caulobacter sp. CCUG 60055]
MGRSPPIILVWLLATAALAETPLPRPDRPPTVSVAAEDGGHGGVVRASFDIAAPPQVVWAVLTDCDHARDMVPNLVSCRVLDRDPAGRWDVREHIAKTWFTPRLRNVIRTEFDPPHGLSYRRIAGDWTRSEGRWTLTATDGGAATHLDYEGHMALGVAVPSWAVREAARHELPQALAALRRACLAAEAARPPAR